MTLQLLPWMPTGFLTLVSCRLGLAKAKIEGGCQYTCILSTLVNWYAVLFWYALTGSDTVSQFLGREKVSEEGDIDMVVTGISTDGQQTLGVTVTQTERSILAGLNALQICLFQIFFL